MASYKVSSILTVLALVGCVLKGLTAEKSEQPIEQSNRNEKIIMDQEELDRALRNDDLTNEQIEQKLKSTSSEAVLYTNPVVRYWARSVAKLAEICDVSMNKCSGDRAEYIKDLVVIYEKTIPRMFQYGEYCHAKLINYCYENIDQVVDNFYASVSEEAENLINQFKEALQKKNLLDQYHRVDKKWKSIKKAAEIFAKEREKAAESSPEFAESGRKDREILLRTAYANAHSAFWKAKSGVGNLRELKRLGKQIIKVFNNFMLNHHKGKISIDQKELFLHKIVRYGLYYNDIYKLLDNIDEKHELEQANKSASELLKLAKIVGRFRGPLAHEIYLELQEKKGENKPWAEFKKQTEDELLSSQKEKKEAADENEKGSKNSLSGCFGCSKK